MKRLSYLLCFVLSIVISVGCCGHSQLANNPAPNLISHLQNSTVSLVLDHPILGLRSYCSGVWINSNTIVTAKHCVEDDDGNVEVGEIIQYAIHSDHDNRYPISNDKKIYIAKVAHYTENSDIAILTAIDDVNHSIARISNTSIPVGLNVHIIGHPIGLQWTYITGVVSAVRYIKPSFVKNEFKTIHIAAFIMGGNSGGGAFDNNGNLIGVASFIVLDQKMPSAGMSFFVHKDILIELLAEENIKYYQP